MSKLRNCKYKSVVKAATKFQPWDYGFLLNIELVALKQMRDFIKTKGCHLNAERDSERINTTIKLLEISLDRNYEWEKVNKGIIYVNTKNKRRFYPNDTPDYVLNNLSNWTVREEKAWYLYCKMREYWYRTWWD